MDLQTAGKSILVEKNDKPLYNDKLRDNKGKGAFILETAKRKLNDVVNCRGDWAPIELTVASGATDTVTAAGLWESIEADKTNADVDGGL